MKLDFYKYEGTGNDFIVLDNRNGHWQERLGAKTIAWLCDRHFGIGADGLMMLEVSPHQDFYMRYYNSDGHLSTMCGNGGRCLAHFAHFLGVAGPSLTFEAVDGIHHATIGKEVSLSMGQAQGFRSISAQADWVDTGSPHLVVFVQEALSEFPVVPTGRKLRHAAEFAPAGTNVNFVSIEQPGVLAVRTYERGVEDETLSCGTGVTACAFVYAKKNPNLALEEIEIHAPGGRLFVRWEEKGTAREKLWLQGPVRQVFEGSIVLPAS